MLGRSSRRKIPSLRDAIVFLQSLDQRQLEQLRTDVEIWIYHEEERLGFAARYSWFFCAVSAFVAILGKDILTLIVTIVVAGLASTMKLLNSRTAAIALIVIGGLIGVDAPYRLLAPGRPHEITVALALGTVVLGAAGVTTVVRLRNLRAFRALIPLPPAKHLLEPEQ